MEKYLKDDANLRNVLLYLPQKKYIFTNCNEIQARSALECLGVADCFEGIFGASFMGEYCKPNPIVFQRIFDHLNITDPSTTCLFEDSFKNLVTASSLGMATVLIESMTAIEEGVTDADRQQVNCVLPSLSDADALITLQMKLPQLRLHE